jgi:hypothetical protein
LTHNVIVTLAALGVVGQVLAALLLLVGLLTAAGLRGPLRCVSRGRIELHVREPGLSWVVDSVPIQVLKDRPLDDATAGGYGRAADRANCNKEQ